VSSPYFSPYPQKIDPQKITKELIAQIGKDKILKALRSMIQVRHFEVRGESAYQQGLVGGFYHSYTGQEAIQTAVVEAMGQENWYVGFYRCHALALLLGASPNELMAELYGRANGNAKGRGGSMHLYTKRMLGGFAIVGGHLPIAIGAAFTIKYQKKKEVAVCFLGEGAVAQGAFHESLNLAALWNLPVIFVIENNHWGMGTHESRAICISRIAEKQAPSYGIKGYTLNGMDFFNCYAGFKHIYNEVLETSRPVLVECMCERFRGHSISDPGLYRTKEQLAVSMQDDPIVHLRDILEKEGLLTAAEYEKIDREEKQIVIDAMKYAENSPFPSTTTLEEEVYAP
jgi:pyruvate dehydrogenase E1 component alpha subunit